MLTLLLLASTLRPVQQAVPEINAPDASGKVWSFSGMGMDPMSGEAVNFDEKVTVTDNDHHLFEMYGPGPDGKVYKMMEISYTRKK